MITVIDSGMANIGSVLRALDRIGAAAEIAKTPEAVSAASALILPGVGAFADGMQSLRRLYLVAPIKEAARKGIPMLGICLGMQLMARQGLEFGRHEGLGLIAADVARLKPGPAGERVPNVGWCDVSRRPASRLFERIEDGTSFYFMHSYCLQCADPDLPAGAMTFGGTATCVAVEAGNLFGVQFHPEKSQDHGLRLLHNFARIASSERRRGDD